MDRHALVLFIPIIVMGFTGLIAFSFTPLGRAIARRIGGQASSGVDERVAQLEVDMDGVRRELDATHERLDFAERALAQVKEQRQLPAGPH